MHGSPHFVPFFVFCFTLKPCFCCYFYSSFSLQVVHTHCGLERPRTGQAVGCGCAAGVDLSAAAYLGWPTANIVVGPRVSLAPSGATPRLLRVLNMVPQFSVASQMQVACRQELKEHGDQTYS